MSITVAADWHDGTFYKKSAVVTLNYSLVSPLDSSSSPLSRSLYLQLIAFVNLFHTHLTNALPQIMDIVDQFLITHSTADFARLSSPALHNTRRESSGLD